MGVRPSDRPTRRLVLASASPARLELLRAAGFDPVVIPSHVAEDGVDGLPTAEAARHLAERKAGAVAEELAVAAEAVGSRVGAAGPAGRHGGASAAAGGAAIGNDGPAEDAARWLVVGCDSLLVVAGAVRGKPRSVDEAREWWRTQRGASGTLITGHCVVEVATGRRVSGVAETEVQFGEPTDAEIEAYLATGEPLQVAGAATIEGYGAPFIDGIRGDHGTVLGLSLPLLRRLLRDLGIAITELWVPRP